MAMVVGSEGPTSLQRREPSPRRTMRAGMRKRFNRVMITPKKRIEVAPAPPRHARPGPFARYRRAA
jgi:hypothetical protein